MDARLEFIYHGNRMNDFYQEYHQHHCYELVYYVRGRGVTNFSNRTCSYKAGTCSLTRPNIKHDRHHLEETEFLVIGFCHDLPIELDNGVFADIGGNLYGLLEKIRDEVFSQHVHYQMRIQILIQDLVIQLDRCMNGARKQKNDDWLTYVLNYIDIHYNEDIDVGTLATCRTTATIVSVINSKPLQEIRLSGTFNSSE